MNVLIVGLVLVLLAVPPSLVWFVGRLHAIDQQTREQLVERDRQERAAIH